MVLLKCKKNVFPLGEAREVLVSGVKLQVQAWVSEVYGYIPVSVKTKPGGWRRSHFNYHVAKNTAFKLSFCHKW